MQNKSLSTRILAFAAAALAVVMFSVAPVASYAGNKSANKALNAAIKAAPKYSGKISAIDTTKETVTIKSKKIGVMTFAVTATTKIKSHGDKGSLTFSDLAKGDQVTVHSADKTTALQITIHPKTIPGAKPAPTPAA